MEVEVEGGGGEVVVAIHVTRACSEHVFSSFVLTEGKFVIKRRKWCSSW